MKIYSREDCVGNISRKSDENTVTLISKRHQFRWKQANKKETICHKAPKMHNLNPSKQQIDQKYSSLPSFFSAISFDEFTKLCSFKSQSTEVSSEVPILICLLFSDKRAHSFKSTHLFDGHSVFYRRFYYTLYDDWRRALSLDATTSTEL